MIHRMARGDSSISVGLTAESQDLLERIARGRAMQKKYVVERVLAWFVEQDGLLQGLILRQIPPEHAADIVTLLYEQHCAAAGGGTTADARADDKTSLAAERQARPGKLGKRGEA